MTNKLIINGNSMRYTTTQDGEEIVFTEVDLPTRTLNRADRIVLTGGNMEIDFPQDVEWNIKLKGDTAVVTV